MSQLARFDFCIEPNQQLDAVIKLPKEERGIIHGIVLDQDDHLVEGAVVKLFEVGKKCDDKCKCIPITHTFTDRCGQFVFGPLCVGKLYAVKIWANDVCQTAEEVDLHQEKSCLKYQECKKKKHEEHKDFTHEPRRDNSVFGLDEIGTH